MKALSLHVPHAVLIPFRWKEVETRGWYTGYRGPLAIHAAKTFTADQKYECARLEGITSRLNSLGGVPENHAWRAYVTRSLGCIVATCELVACIPTAFVRDSALKLHPSFSPALGWEVEQKMGKYDAGRWAWILRDVVPVDPPLPATGARKLWEWDPGVVLKKQPDNFGGGQLT